ncbi:DUF2510 domain-containing protein [Okibacterium fritillariae]|uniref:DUF2510 domain-containing protein n=1 Tax=Okibacterium fritillariae TaxID=123320 RepID=UPI0040557492
MSEAPPPYSQSGWYGAPDGSARQRWWNGETWTSDYRPIFDGDDEPASVAFVHNEEHHPLASASREVDPESQSAPAPVSKSGKGCGIGCLAVLMVIVITCVGGWIIGSTSQSDGSGGSYRGCSKLLPSDAFHDCIYREGIYSGIG